MGRTGELGSKHGTTKRRILLKDQGSESSNESDDDFTVGESEEFESDEYCSSLDPFESDEGIGEFDFDQKDEETPQVKKTHRSCSWKGVPSKRDKKVEQKKISYLQKEDDDDNDSSEDDDDDDVIFTVAEIDLVDDEDEIPFIKTGRSSSPRGALAKRGKKVKKKKSSYKQEESDDDDFIDDDNDVEFKLDEIDFVGDEVETSIRMTGRSSSRKGVPTKKGKKIKKNKKISYKQDDENDEDDYDDDDVEFKLDETDFANDEDETPVIKTGRSSFRNDVLAKKGKKIKKKNISYKQDDDDDDADNDVEFTLDGIGFVDNEDETQFMKKERVSYKEKDNDYDDDDDDDEEFTLDRVDFIDEEDEMPLPNNNKKASKPRPRQIRPPKGQKRKKNSKVINKPTPTSKSRRTNLRLVHKTSSGSDREFANKILVVKDKNIPCRRRRRYMAVSDSSDDEYKVPEEHEDLTKKSQLIERKGKEKVEDLKKEIVKQICGICLSEEGKRTIRGTLNCCSHFFCFACIMEWSKVESRCPLCKQRFVTISKLVRSYTRFGFRTVVIQVPKCDQVYQPSEEELRQFLDPYDEVTCTECQQGGDDALMLLCDICDSPAHTYCVGLGREVPEGNWYCEGCRPAVSGPLNPDGPTPAPTERSNNNLSGPSTPIHNAGEFDLNSFYVPDTPLTQGPPGYPFPRPFLGDFQASGSSQSGSGASTLFERRRIQGRIHDLLNNRRGSWNSPFNMMPSTNSGIRLFGSQIDLGTELAFPQNSTPERIGFQYNTSNFSSGFGQFSGQGQNRNPFSANINGMLQAEHAGIMGFNSGLSSEQFNPCSSSGSTMASDGLPPYAFREVRIPPRMSQGPLQTPFRNNF